MVKYPSMRIIKLKHLRDFWLAHADAQPGLRKWAAECGRARWRSFEDVKAYARSADYVGNNRVVFNICGNGKVALKDGRIVDCYAHEHAQHSDCVYNENEDYSND